MSSSSPNLPSSYATIPTQHIRLSHIPSSSPVPTPVILITLHRPQNRNAFTDLMASELVSIFNLLSHDSRVKAIVLTGHGNIFCAGADLDLGLTYSNDTPLTYRDGGGKITLAIHQCTKPVIAAINGAAVGVGITMTLPCAIRVVSEDAKIGFVFGRRGIIMEAASSFFLPKLVGLSRAMHLVTTGEVYGARHELLSGLWGEVVKKDKVLERAVEIAQGVAEGVSSVSWALMRDLMWRGPGTAEETHLLDSKILLELINSKDKEEGVDSFLQKREADFKGNMQDNAPSVWPWWVPVDTKVPGGLGGGGKSNL